MRRRGATPSEAMPDAAAPANIVKRPSRDALDRFRKLYGTDKHKRVELRLRLRKADGLENIRAGGGSKVFQPFPWFVNPVVATSKWLFRSAWSASDFHESAITSNLAF